MIIYDAKFALPSTIGSKLKDGETLISSFCAHVVVQFGQHCENCPGLAIARNYIGQKI